MKRKHISAIIILIGALIVTFYSGRMFLSMYQEEPIVTGPGVSSVVKLSTYFPGLEGSYGDTDVYIMKGREPGGSTLVLGGTHPNEPAAYIASVVLIENVVVKKGTLYVIPRSNRSAFTHNDPQEGAPQRFYIETPFGERWFRFGSRATNPVHQWPDPDVYIHAASGQQLSGSETRNLNRGYPGRADGTFTEQVCYAIRNMINTEGIDLSIDLHEASPEYPVINAIVAHERAMPIAADVAITMQSNEVNIGLEPSPVNLRGLTHRELGDSTETFAVLMESANASQGRLRGRTDEALVLSGVDPMYEKAADLGRLFVPYDENGHPLEVRVARHLFGIESFIISMSSYDGNKAMIVSEIPSYQNMVSRGVGAYLLPVE
ncbi:MAG: succinylglutamate desuccinylase/aspartoacylase family protein [Spirochaetales bacterium]|nr:succinylglutamate desuccinylase/aspartoacylase family protein [Spirochaetales bacterium]